MGASAKSAVRRLGVRPLPEAVRRWAVARQVVAQRPEFHRRRLRPE